MTIKRALIAMLAVLLLPAVAAAQEGTRATFNTYKDFTDDNPMEVEVVIDCNTGLALDQEKDISEGNPVEFVIVDFDSGEMDCEVSETPVSGYLTTYSTDNQTYSTEPCFYEAIEDGSSFDCWVQNEPAPVEIVIVKDWIIENASNDTGVSQEFSIRLRCNSEIIYGYNVYGQWWERNFYGEGDDEFSADVIPNYPNSTCEVEENVFDSAVEVSNGCGQFTVAVNQGYSCTVTNTVFFEGIPTLSQYGLAILALLMLGVGFVGFRRFA